jgi:hypothetical protein
MRSTREDATNQSESLKQRAAKREKVTYSQGVVDSQSCVQGLCQWSANTVRIEQAGVKDSKALVDKY